jgi:hypothetical protein
MTRSAMNGIHTCALQKVTGAAAVNRIRARAAIHPVAKIGAFRRRGRQMLIFNARVQDIVIQSAQNDVPAISAHDIIPIFPAGIARIRTRLDVVVAFLSKHDIPPECRLGVVVAIAQDHIIIGGRSRHRIRQGTRGDRTHGV